MVRRRGRLRRPRRRCPRLPPRPPPRRRQPAGGQRGKPYRAWAAYLALAAISALVIRRPVWLVFAYTVVGSMFFPFVISTLLWLNNTRNVRATRNGVLGAALVLYAFLAIEAF